MPAKVFCPKPPSRSHCVAARIKQIVVVVNKMDLVDFDQQVFIGIREEFERVQATFPDAHVYFVPVVAIDGDNVARRGERMEWFQGPSVLEYLEALPNEENVDAPFRMPIQYVIRAEDYRGYGGQIASGVVTVGDTLLALPSKKTSSGCCHSFLQQGAVGGIRAIVGVSLSK